MADRALLVNDKRRALGKPENAQSPVLPRHRPFLVGENWERRPELGSESLVRLGFVDADRDNLGFRFFELGLAILVGAKFVRSSRGVGENEECQDDILFAEEIGKLNGAAVLVG